MIFPIPLVAFRRRSLNKVCSCFERACICTSKLSYFLKYVSSRFPQISPAMPGMDIRKPTPASGTEFDLTPPSRARNPAKAAVAWPIL